MLTANTAPGTDRLSKAAQADHKNTIEGLQEMFTGYLLYRCSQCLPCEENVHAAYINLKSDLQALTFQEGGSNE